MTVTQRRNRPAADAPEQQRGMVESGIKVTCDFCHTDITNTVRLKCAHDECRELDICASCFTEGKEGKAHKPWHDYMVEEPLTTPIFDPEWGADEESLLISGLITYGLGNWLEVAAYIGTRTKEDCERHYCQTFLGCTPDGLPYDREKDMVIVEAEMPKAAEDGAKNPDGVDGMTGPRAANVSPPEGGKANGEAGDTQANEAVTDEAAREAENKRKREYMPPMSRDIQYDPDTWQARKKARIEAVRQPQALPSASGPLVSAPTNHEVGGYMPGRLEFEHEVDNDAEVAVKDMEFGLVWKYGGDEQPAAKVSVVPEADEDDEEEDEEDEDDAEDDEEGDGEEEKEEEDGDSGEEGGKKKRNKKKGKVKKDKDKAKIQSKDKAKQKKDDNQGEEEGKNGDAGGMEVDADADSKGNDVKPDLAPDAKVNGSPIDDKKVMGKENDKDKEQEQEKEKEKAGEGQDGDGEGAEQQPAQDDIEDEGELEVKLALLDIYFSKLDKREEAKELIFDRGLTDYKKIQAAERRKPKDERELINRYKVFAKLQTAMDFEVLIEGLVYEQVLRRRIAELQEYRRNGVTTGAEAEVYDAAKIARAGYRPVMPRDRPEPVISGARVNAGQHRYLHGVAATPPPGVKGGAGPDGAGRLPGAPNRRPPAPLNLANAQSLDLLSFDEQSLCSQLRILPKPYLSIKEMYIRENERRHGGLKRRDARKMLKIDVNKSGRIFDFLVQQGYLRLTYDPNAPAPVDPPVTKTPAPANGPAPQQAHGASAALNGKVASAVPQSNGNAAPAAGIRHVGSNGMLGNGA